MKIVFLGVIPNLMHGCDWQEIEDARTIAKEALKDEHE